MATVFDKISDVRNDVRRNTFDWSKANNFTTALGRITPVYCELCPPNSSLRIKPDYGLRMMPMMFPVQTRIKAMLSFFRVPLRTLWKDYKDWISSPNDADNKLEPPFMSFPDEFGYSQILGVSGLADYLGVPVTVVTGESVDAVDYGSLKFFNETPLEVLGTSGISTNNVNTFSSLNQFVSAFGPTTSSPLSTDLAVTTGVSSYNRGLDLDSQWLGRFQTICVSLKSLFAESVDVPFEDGPFERVLPLRLTLHVNKAGKAPAPSGTDQTKDWVTITPQIIQLALGYCQYLGIWQYTAGSPKNLLRQFSQLNASFEDGGVVGSISYWDIHFDFPALIKGTVYSGKFTFDSDYDLYLVGAPLYGIFPGKSVFSGLLETANAVTANLSLQPSGAASQPSGVSSLSAETTPYWRRSGNNDNRLKVSAYPFRAYEAVYNAYIRNNKNNPFMLDGKPAYNVWIPNNDGGEDSTDYQLHYANWFSDMFTTAVPSPQQGKAPLVGITTYTEDVILDNGHTETTLKTAIVDEEGNKYGVSFESNGEALKGVKYKMLSSDTPVAPVSLFDLASSGISINDFRNVNAYQRYLELNQMRGFSYKDIIEGRFDVNVRYDDLNMPEYLGGCTRDVNINPVTQVVDMSDSGSYAGALGSQAGNATLFAGSEDISVFCDEESIVIGVLSIVPCPVYSQAIPKWMLYRDRLDSFNPEFDHIGFQPVRVKEIAPIQQFFVDPSKMDDVFGYQRPWYEYCQKLDTVSGLFRTQLRNFLINRVFATVPKLNSAFTTVDPDEVNDVFAVTETTDKILGLMYFDVVAKLPISRVVVPRLE